MAGTKAALVLALGISAGLIAACDNGPSAVGAQAAGTQMAAGSTPAAAASVEDHRKDAVALVDGKPAWAASRRRSADEAARAAFERNGEAFGAETLDAFVRKAHAFVDHPPKGTLTLTRANGDTLYYDPKGNVFAVADKAGAPRTMFKPDEGAAYWEKQKARESRRQARAKHREDEAA
jgi:hypothetical protein